MWASGTQEYKNLQRNFHRKAGKEGGKVRLDAEMMDRYNKGGTARNNLFKEFMFCGGDVAMMATMYETLTKSQKNTLKDKYAFLDTEGLMKLHNNNVARVNNIEAECRIGGIRLCCLLRAIRV